MQLDNFPYARLGLNKSLEEVRYEMFARLDEVQEEYQAKGYLPATLNLNRGPARGLIELGNWGRHKLNSDISALIPQCFAAYATGTWLDLHAADVLLERKAALQATGNIIFQREKNGGNIRIPAGRLVRTKPDGRGEIFRFVTNAEVVMPEDALEISAPVVAETYGQASNLTAGAICEIVTAIAGIDAVTNKNDWLESEGADEEKDDSLRNRYFLQWKSISGLNKYFYESLALSVPGVSAAVVNDRHPRGQGTVDIYILGAAGLPTQNLLDQVSEVVAENKPQIDKALVLSPLAVPVIIKVKLLISYGEHEALKQEVENRVRALFSAQTQGNITPLKISEDLTHSRLIAESMKSAGVKSVVVESPASDLEVPVGGLAVLESLVIESETAEA